MKKKMFLIFFSLICASLYGQVKVREVDVLFRKHIVRSLPLDHPGNEALFGNDHLLVTVLLDAYKNGQLTGYRDQRCDSTLAREAFDEKMKCGEDTSVRYNTAQIKFAEIGEDLIFDRSRSEILFDMKTLTLFLPEEINYRGLLEPLVTFRYEDCMKVFREDNRAYSINPLLNGRNINYNEVFLMRLFVSSIVKIGNNDDLYFDQIKRNEIEAFLEGKRVENELSEYLYKLFHPR